MSRLVDGAVNLIHAAADAVDLGIRLGQLDKSLVAVADGSNRRAHIVLSTAVLGREAVLGTVQAASDLHVALLGVGNEMSRLDKASGEHAGVGGAGHVGLGAESHGTVLVGGNVTAIDWRERQKQGREGNG